MFKFGSKLVKQILAVKQFVAFKSIKQIHKKKSNKQRYKWGSIGTSQVSMAIKKDRGSILSRQERKRLAKESGNPFQAYYNGNVYRGHVKIKPSKYPKKNKRKGA